MHATARTIFLSKAAITSFFLFAIGAIIPVFPFIFTNGFTAVVISLILSVLGLFGIGAGVSLTAGSPLWKSGGRQILLGLLAAGITFGLGKLIGRAVGLEPQRNGYGQWGNPAWGTGIREALPLDGAEGVSRKMLPCFPQKFLRFIVMHH